jgi:hypothetical protein
MQWLWYVRCVAVVGYITLKTPKNSVCSFFRTYQYFISLCLLGRYLMARNGIMVSKHSGSICASGVATLVVNCGTVRVPMGLPM